MTLCTPCYNYENAVQAVNRKYAPSLSDDETCGRCGCTSDEERTSMLDAGVGGQLTHGDSAFTFSEYQEQSKKTAQGYAHPSVVAGDGMPEEKLLFLATAINGEAGEIGEKIKKCVREDDVDYLGDVEDEIGDVLWYLAQLCSLLDADFGTIAEENLEKLFDRQERGAITGEGDTR